MINMETSFVQEVISVKMEFPKFVLLVNTVMKSSCRRLSHALMDNTIYKQDRLNVLSAL
jgi:hypothetical protein